jgi:hypothetical protein
MAKTMTMAELSQLGTVESMSGLQSATGETLPTEAFKIHPAVQQVRDREQAREAGTANTLTMEQVLALDEGEGADAAKLNAQQVPLGEEGEEGVTTPLRFSNILADGINLGIVRTFDLPAEFVTTLVEQGSRLIPGDNTIDMSGLQGGFEKLYRAFAEEPEQKNKLERITHMVGELAGGSVGGAGVVAKVAKTTSALGTGALASTTKQLAPVRELGHFAKAEALTTVGSGAAGTAVASVVSEEQEELAFAGGSIASAISPTLWAGKKIVMAVVDTFTEKGQTRKALKSIESDLPKTPDGDVDYDALEARVAELAKLEKDTGQKVAVTGRSVADTPGMKARQEKVNAKFRQESDEMFETAKVAQKQYLEQLEVAKTDDEIAILDSTLETFIEDVGNEVKTIADKIQREKDVLISTLDTKKMTTLEGGVKLTKTASALQKVYRKTINLMYETASPGKKFRFNVSEIDAKVEDIIQRRGVYSGLDEESPKFIRTIVSEALESAKGAKSPIILPDDFVRKGADKATNTYEQLVGRDGLLRKLRSQMREELAVNGGSSKYRALADLEKTVSETIQHQLPPAQFKAFSKADSYFRDEYAPRFIQGLGGKIRKTAATGEAALHREDILEQVWNQKNLSEVEDFKQLYNSSPEAMEILKDHAIRDLFKKLKYSTNVQQDFDKWKDSFEDHLAAFPEIAKDVDSFGTAQKAFKKIADVEEANAKKLAAARIKPFSVDNPQGVINKSLESPKYAQNFKDLVLKTVESPQEQEEVFGAVRRLLWEDMQGTGKKSAAEIAKYVEDNKKTLEIFMGKESVEEMVNYGKLTDLLEKNPQAHVSEPEFNVLFKTLEKLGIDPLKMMVRLRHRQMGFLSTSFIVAERFVETVKKVTDKHYMNINKSIMLDGEQLRNIGVMRRATEKVRNEEGFNAKVATGTASGNILNDDEEFTGSMWEDLIEDDTAPVEGVQLTDTNVPVEEELPTTGTTEAPSPTVAPTASSATISAEEIADIDSQVPAIPVPKERKQDLFLQREAKGFETYQEYEDTLRETFQGLSDKGQKLNSDAFERIKPRLQAAWDAVQDDPEDEDKDTLDAMEELLMANRRGTE